MRDGTTGLRLADLQDSRPIHHRVGYGSFRYLARFLCRSAGCSVDSCYRIQRCIHQNTTPTHYPLYRIDYNRSVESCQLARSTSICLFHPYPQNWHLCMLLYHHLDIIFQSDFHVQRIPTLLRSVNVCLPTPRTQRHRAMSHGRQEHQGH